MLVIHANWTDGALHLWGESATAHRALRAGAAAHTNGAAAQAATADTVAEHPFTVGAIELRAALDEAGVIQPDDLADMTTMTMRLPADATGPRASEQMASVDAMESPDDGASVWLGGFTVETVTVRNDRAIGALAALERSLPTTGLEAGRALKYWMRVGRAVGDLLVQQRFVPSLTQDRTTGVAAAWQPWFHDDRAIELVGGLLDTMPPVARAVDDRHRHQAWPILSEATTAWTDAAVRRLLVADDFPDALEGKTTDDLHVAWLSGLLGDGSDVDVPERGAVDLLQGATAWLERLDETDRDQPLRLVLRVEAPLELSGDADEDAKTAHEQPWRVTIHVRAAEGADVETVSAEDLWSGEVLPPGKQTVTAAQEFVLRGLDRAARIDKRLEQALRDASPAAIEMPLREAYDFLTRTRSILEEAGIEVQPPVWWGQSTHRLNVRLHIQPTAEQQAAQNSVPGGAAGAGLLGLQSLIQYQWRIAVGDQTLTFDEFRALAAHALPLARIRGRWVELSADDLAEAVRFLDEQGEGEMTLLRAMQLAHGSAELNAPLPVAGVEAEGWIQDLLSATTDPQGMPQLDQPKTFHGELRPYQKSGLSWLAFLDSFALGGCLADDMGLGKTIQLIALLLHERENAAPNEQIGPTLLVVPTSVLSNWARELDRFGPSLSYLIHHGPDRPDHDQLIVEARQRDVILTTYALVTRDRETLLEIPWHRVVLEEAQYIKNPPTKQAQAIRALNAARRVALTGTPVENRLTELWSIMDFCNPGYLGAQNEFRKRIATPIERRRDQHKAEQLRGFVQPFILRRLKTDPKVIDDLPACLETREYATLTREQADLYQATVDNMLTEVDRAEGIQRRGLVLATLVKLKQICNHPAQMLRESVDKKVIAANGQGQLSQRSGKTKRLMAMLEEVLAVGERALIFTQFSQMGHLLSAMIEHDLNCNTLFLHGGTPQKKRQVMIDQFQDPEGDTPVFVLSLKAGGLGLNLTAANHVFHYDRWWNPAVENQATDRAFRIGQTRTVHVHKFVCLGTLEEQIDQMIEQKTELAEHIIGSGEQWLTELSTQQLGELMSLRTGALESEA